MKRIVPVLIGLTALLTACPQPTPPIDPLTLSFTGTGSTTFKPAATTTLVGLDENNNEVASIGTLSTDGTVNVTITPGMIPTLKTSPIKEFGIAGCTGQPVGPENMTYYYFNRAYLKGTSTSVVPNTFETTPDGIRHHIQNGYLYINQAGRVTGSFQCPDFVGPVEHTLDLKAGWNHVEMRYTYDPSTKKYGNYSQIVATQPNVYTGPWRYINY